MRSTPPWQIFLTMGECHMPLLQRKGILISRKYHIFGLPLHKEQVNLKQNRVRACIPNVDKCPRFPNTLEAEWVTECGYLSCHAKLKEGEGKFCEPLERII